MDVVTVNKVVKIRYVASKFTTGLTDLVLAVRKPDGSLLFPAPTFTELWGSGEYEGVYEASYTPDVVGVWEEKITSAINGDKAIRSHNVVAYDILDVKTQTQSIETKVDATKVVVDATKVVVDAVNVKVDSILSEINPGGYFA